MDSIDHLANELHERATGLNGLKTIVLTWSDTRPGYHGELLAALWIAEGTDADLNAAIRYSRPTYHMRVHTFAPDDPTWKQSALEAHRNGCGL